MSSYQRFVVLITSGLGVGYLPGPKGTYGSLLGVGYYLLLRKINGCAYYSALVLLGTGVAIGLCTYAEQIFGRKDPQEIVLDEIACFPVAMSGSEFLSRFPLPHWPWGYPTALFWVNVGVVFVLYRVFDILKPPPLRRAQLFSGGWGIVLDDFLAGIYTALISTILLWVWFWVKNSSA